MSPADKLQFTAMARAACVGIIATPSRDDAGNRTVILTRGAWTKEIRPHELDAALAELHQFEEAMA